MISEIIEKWIKGILIDGITGNLSGLFDNVNAKVGEIASDVGSTPQAWNSGIFNMLRSLSETVVLPIAAAILALVMCHELIQMITEKNNMHDFDTSMFFRWIFKSAFAILIVSNTWNIVMGVFDATQSVVNQSSGVIIGETSILIDRANEDKETSVHFLNQVDDADLLALLDEGPQAAEVCICTVKCEAGDVNENCPLCEKSLRNCTAPEAVKTDTETPQEKTKSNMDSLIVLLVLALAGGGVALYYFKFRKPKADTTGHDDLDEYDFGEDEDADEEPTEIEENST